MPPNDLAALSQCRYFVIVPKRNVIAKATTKTIKTSSLVAFVALNGRRLNRALRRRQLSAGGRTGSRENAAHLHTGACARPQVLAHSVHA
mgnify:CR=1 FL=1